MTPHRLLPFVCAALFAPALAAAQTPPAPAPSSTPATATAEAPSRTVTFVEALRLAFRQPPAVRAALARIAIANHQIEQARAAWLPTVGVSSSPTVSYSDRPGQINPLTGQTVRFQNSAFNVDGTASVRWNVYDFGRTSANVRATERGRDATTEDARTAGLQAVQSASQQYLAVLGDLEAIESARVSLAQREAHLRIAHGRVEAGAAGPNDEVRAQVDLDAGRLDLSAAEAQLLGDRAALTATLGLDPVHGVEVVRVAPDDLAVDDDPARAARDAMAARPEFAAARFRLEQAEAQRDLARANRLPAITASGSGSISHNEVLSGTGLGGNAYSLGAGLGVSWSAYDGSLSPALRAAESAVTAAQETLDAQSLTVRTLAVQAALATRSARAQLEQAERLAAGAAANLELASGRYAGGAAPLLELVDAQAADASARVAVVRAHVTLALSRAQLLSTTGRLERFVQ